VSLGYPEDVIVRATRSCEEVLAAVTTGADAFSGVHRDWLARLRSARRAAPGR